MKNGYCIQLDSKNPKVLDYSAEDIKHDMAYFKFSKVSQLSDYEFKVFFSKSEAEKFLKKFKKGLRSLRKLKDGGWKPGPTLTYKRHYLVLSYLGEKLQTYRDKNRKWKPGTIIKLHDQTYFLLVRLKSIKKTPDGFKYSFSVQKR